ncbi:MAG: glycoside hydrolase family 15 protein [Patescibacteria group bacterium]|nr:glycoside hydrolase family 15 protein [Patescibacteria group bacterium]
MGRPVVLSNGQLFVGLDESGLVHDFYYPYVGLENLTNARSSQHKIGVWVNNRFSWTDDGSWKIHVDFEDDALISNISMRSESLQITLQLRDFIDSDNNSFIRNITISNESDSNRDIRLFMHQVFQISRAGRADTAIYVPDEHYLLDYKGRFCLLIAGQFEDDTNFDQYAVGNYAIEGKAGTYLDALDGELSGNAVEHGGVDSVLRFQKEVPAGESVALDYWIVAGSTQNDVEAVHVQYKRQAMADRVRHVRQNWQEWIGGGDVELPDFHKRSLQHSMMIIKAHCDDRGSVLASGDSSIFNYGRDYYCYCWPRDAAYALWPLIRLGHLDEARQSLEFFRDTMHPDGYLMHKYQPDRAIGSTWHPLVHGHRKELAIQEDETASILFMIGELYEASEDIALVESMYASFIQPCANFMTKFIDKETGLPHATYDLWEEKFLTTTYTVCTVIAGLMTASKLAKVLERAHDAITWQQAAEGIKANLNKLYHPDGYFRKGFLLHEDGSIDYDDTMDISSLYGPFMYAGLAMDDERLISTAKHVEERILNTSPAGGVIRYENDNYFLTKREYKGNPWIVSTLWLAQYYATAGQTEKAQELLEWALARELPSGVLSEQFDPADGSPLGVTPLVWSHAELVNTILDLSK